MFFFVCVFFGFFFKEIQSTLQIRSVFDLIFHCVISPFLLHAVFQAIQYFSLRKQVHHHLSSTSYSLKTILKHSMDEWNEFYWVIELYNESFALKIKNYLHSQFNRNGSRKWKGRRNNEFLRRAAILRLMWLRRRMIRLRKRRDFLLSFYLCEQKIL